MRITLSKFNEEFLELSWVWLSDIEIKHLTNTADFTKEQQKEWYRSLRFKNDYLIWGIYADSTPIGVCGLKNITEIDCEYWGYIGNKQFWGKGIGSKIIDLMEDKARKLKILSIWLRVTKENLRAVSLYNKMGYKYEREMEFLYVMRKVL